MIRTISRTVWLWLLLSSSLVAQSKVTKLRGTVEDATTKKPVAGATVSASGDTARQDEITDDKGFFRILIQGIAPGDLVRIRVEKPGYTVYDRQVVASEEIPLSVSLRRSAGTTPPSDRKAVEPAAPVTPPDPVVAQYVEVLKGQNPSLKIHALDVLANYAPTDKTAMASIVGAALDYDYRVKEQAIYYMVQLKPTSKQAVTNLLIDLRDPEPEVQGRALQALDSFPRDDEALNALFRSLGAPPRINPNVMYKLFGWGVKDPRLSEAIYYEVTQEDSFAVNEMLKEAPLSQEWIARVIADVKKSLDVPEKFHQQGTLRVLLKGGGEAGREALHQLLNASDPYQQSRLILCWLEVDTAAAAEILNIAPAAVITAELKKALRSAEAEFLFLPSQLLPRKTAIGCQRGVRLRAAMGILLLGLEPREDAWDVLAFELDRQAINRGDLRQNLECLNYAAAVPGSLSPVRAKPAIPLLIQNLPCYFTNKRSAKPEIVEYALARVGDEDTITLLQRSAAQGTVICGSGRDDPGGKKKLADLIARIRGRVDK